MARVKNFIKWWLIWTVLIEIFLVFYDPATFLSLSGLFWTFVICLFPALFIVSLKGFYNVGEGIQPWGLRSSKQAKKPPKHRKKNKKRGVLGSLLNAPHAAAQKGANAVGNMLNFGSGNSDNSYAEWQAKKKAADDEVWRQTQEANQKAWQRWRNEEDACQMDYKASQCPEGSFDETMYKNYAQEDRNKNQYL